MAKRSNKIVASFERNNPFELLTERSIIYPIYEKSVTADPFFTLYQAFRHRLFREDITIIVGYSFRDVSINNAFLDWLITKRESRPLIVARKENEHLINNIFANNSRIQFINRYFGEDRFVEELENTLKRPISSVR